MRAVLTTRCCGGAILFVVAPVVIASSASAARGQQAVLHWSAPADCSEPPTFASEVPLEEGQTIEAWIEIEQPDVALWRLAVRTEGQHGNRERRLEGESCEAVVRAARVIVALAANPAAVVAPAPLPVIPPEPEMDRTEPPEQLDPPQDDDGGSALAFGPRMMVGAGLLPGAALGVGLDAGWLSLPFRIGIGVDYFFARPENLSGSVPAAGGDFDALSLRSNICYAVVPDPFRVFGCAGLGIDVMRGDGRGISNPTNTIEAWPVGTLGIEIDVIIASWAELVLGVEGWVAPLTTKFEIESLGEVYDPSVVGVRGSVGARLLL